MAENINGSNPCFFDVITWNILSYKNIVITQKMDEDIVPWIYTKKYGGKNRIKRYNSMTNQKGEI